MVLTFPVGFYPFPHSGSTIDSGGPVPKVIHMCSLSTVLFFDKFVTNIENETFAPISCTPQARSTPCVCFAVCIRILVKLPHFDSTTTTSDSVLAGIVMSFAIGFVACSFFSSSSTSGDNIVVILASLPLPSTGAGAKFTGTLLRYMGSIPKCICRYTSFLVRHSLPCFGQFRTKFKPTALLFIQRMGLHTEYVSPLLL